MPTPQPKSFFPANAWVNLPLFIALLTTHAAPAATATQPSSSGATTPWTTLQAESASTTGQILSSLSLPNNTDIASEAVGRAAVKLAQTGHSLTFTVPASTNAPFNAIVVRYCIPDSPKDTTLTLKHNGGTIASLSLTARHAWLYGKAYQNGQSNTPTAADGSASTPHAFFDEARLLLPKTLAPGDTLTLEKTSADTADYYIIDLVDFELVPPPAKKPPTYLNVIDYGALPNDNQDDTAAFEAAIESASRQRKGLFIPPGTYHQSRPLLLDRIKLRGAGPWYTAFAPIAPPNAPPEKKTWAGNLGMRLSGGYVDIGDFAILGSLTNRTDAKQHGITGGGDFHTIENIWVEHTDTGAWIGDIRDSTIRNCRFRNTYADGINVNNHSARITIENCHARGNGDDGLAIFSNPDHQGAQGDCQDITLRNNTTAAQWWGNGIGVYGGRNLTISHNLIDSSASGAGLLLSSGFKSWPTDNVTISHNTFTHAGGFAWKQPWGAFSIQTPGKELNRITFSHNSLSNSPNLPIRIAGGDAGSFDLTLQNNLIQPLTTSPAIDIFANAKGTLTLKDNTPNPLPIRNRSDPTRLTLKSSP